MNRHVDHLLTRYILGQLSSRQAQRVESHLQGCPSCRASLHRYRNLVRQVNASLTDLDPQMASRNAADLVRRSQQQSATQSNLRWAMLPATVIVLLLALPVLINTNAQDIRQTQLDVTAEQVPALDTTAIPPSVSSSSQSLSLRIGTPTHADDTQSAATPIVQAAPVP
ncbi:MAG: hypothetical protein GYB68_05215 [Chloroflexi bacterium]|nr:hypothetical protein [Chloroflexota bacterium]